MSLRQDGSHRAFSPVPMLASLSSVASPRSPGAEQRHSPLKRTQPALVERILASTWIVIALMLLTALLVYLPAIGGEQVWDDAYLIGSNEFFRSPLFAGEVFRQYLYPETFSLYYRPVQNLSYILDYWIWCENTVGYHLTNIFLHASSAFLLFLVLSRILPGIASKSVDFSGAGVALLVSFVWLLHPIHHAAVAYISGRADSLASLFALGAWLLYLLARGWRTRGARVFAFGGIVVFGLLALCSKEVALVWIALFVCWALVFESDSSLPRKGLAVGTVALLVFAYWVVRQLPEHRDGIAGPPGLPWPDRIVLVLRAVGDYARLLVFPYELHMERTVLGPGEENGLVRFGMLAVIGVLVLSVAVAFAFLEGPGRKVRVFGLLWFLIGFLPISNLIPLNATVAEHWIYMPSIGALVFLAGCVLAIPQSWLRVASAFVIAWALALGVRTAFKVQDWTSNERLFTRTIEATGGSARIHMNLAVLHLQRGELQEAERLLRDALVRFPDAEPIRIKLGSVLRRQGRTAEAEGLLNENPARADEIAKQHVATWNESLALARIRQSEGRTAEALGILADACARFPHVWDVYALRANILAASEGPEAAAALVQDYAHSHWWSYRGHMTLGRLRFALNDARGAIQAFDRAALLDIHAGEPFLAIAEVQAARGDDVAARAALDEATRRDPRVIPPRQK